MSLPLFEFVLQELLNLDLDHGTHVMKHILRTSRNTYCNPYGLASNFLDLYDVMGKVLREHD